MVDKLGEVISVTITRETKAVAQMGFGTLLFVGDVANTKNEGFPGGWSTRYKEYTDPAELSADGFDTAKAVYKAATVYFSQTPRPTKFAVGWYKSTAAPPEDIEDGLDEIVKVNDTWYGLTCSDRTDGSTSDAWKAAQWCQTRPKMFGVASDDVKMYDPADNTSIGYLTYNASHERSFTIYSSDAASTTDVKGWMDVAWFGCCLPRTPGGVTWAFKTLSQVEPDDQLTSAQRAAIWLKTVHNASLYDTVGGVKVTRYGTVASGEFIDVMIGCDWLTARIKERIFTKLANLPKVPYTKAGIALIVGEVRSVLQEGVDNGFLDSIDYCRGPDIANITQADKATRHLSGVEFRARLAGAVHTVAVEGTVYV